MLEVRVRWAIALFLACSLAGCRRSAPAPEPATPPVAAEPAVAPEPATQPAVVADPAPSLQPTTPAAETAPPAKPAAELERLEQAPVPPPVRVARAPETSAPPGQPDPADEKEDHRLYRWEDDDGAIHFGKADEIPPGKRKSARVVNAGVDVITVDPLELSPSQPEPSPAPQPDPGAGTAERKGPGDQPELDENGLPIPGTMKDTRATSDAKAAGERNIDPAAVERRRQEDLRRMNCKEKDGVWICG